MLTSSNYQLNNTHYSSLLQFKAGTNPISAPIETVQKITENVVDTFVPSTNDAENKKKRRRAIAVGSTVVVLGALTMLLNPKNSDKMMNRLKTWQKKLDIKVEQSRDDFHKSKFMELIRKGLEKIEKAGNIYFNLNSGKDLAFQSMCTNSNKKYPEFLTKNKTVHNIVKKVDDAFVKVFKKPHEKITKWFDSISRWTVKNSYRKSAKKLDAFEASIRLMRDKLPASERAIVDAKLNEIAQARKVFSEAEVLKRLGKQEKLMNNLSDDLWNKIYNSKDGFAKNSTSFWVQDALKPQKELVEKEGKNFVEKLIGSKENKGLYDDILDVFKKHLNSDDIKQLENELSKTGKKLKKSNFVECSEYFDKKRDLVVGGAPTDIVTQIFGLGLCGLAVSNADKENRLQKLFTTGLPIVTGLGSSLIFSALLYSGGVGLLAGAAVSGVTSLVCHFIDKNVFGNPDIDDEPPKELPKEMQKMNEKNKPLEVKYA